MTATQQSGPSDGDGGSDRLHAVHFYEHDEELADSVGAFIGEGLLAGEAAVIIASEAHRRLFVDRLGAMGIDVEAARVAGNLTILDAAGTLAKVMAGAGPDPDLFNRIVGGVIAAGCARGPAGVRLRAYGEMVDMLWQAGNHQAAIALEELWNDLGGSYPFDLLCAYAMAGFRGAAGAALSDVCDAHSDVSVATAPTAGGSTADDAGALASRTRSLAAEIAHRKQVEQTLRASVRALRRALQRDREQAARTAKLAEHLKETVRINELFMGVLAHDLRTPLGAIMAAAQLVITRDERTGDGRNTKALGRIVTSGERMSRMIEQLLDFTRLRVGGGIEIEPKRADLAAVARQAVGELDVAYPDCAIDVRSAGDTTGVWDGDRLTQVLSNLVANALQHGVPAAGVRVVVDGSADDVVRVQVHNMGEIPAALIPQIFDPMTGGQPRRDRSRGLGLGLFIGKRLAVAHGGDIEVSSNESEGTTFTLSVPRVAGDAAARSRRALSAPEWEGDRPRDRPNLANLAQDRLRETEVRFRLLVEAVKDYAIFMLDPNGRIMSWNAGAQRIKGYEAREIIGQHFSVFYEEDEARSGKCERELEVAAREGRFEDEGWRLRKDGSKFWANVVITALRSENGELVGFAKVTRDLSDRRRLEQEQMRLAKAEEAIRLRDEFLSLAAHELKTPLTVLQLQLDTLGDRMGQSGQRMATKLHRATRSSERLAGLVESLLDASRIATGRFALRMDEFDVVECAAGVVDGLRLSADQARCELSFDAAEPIVGTWDRLRLEQALTNMLANAIKYGAGKPVRVAVRQDGGTVTIEVRDHGPGIPHEEMQRIFQRFERASSVRNYGGLGLGLYLIQAIADAHGGSVVAANMPDGGARFQFILPLRPVVALSDEAPEASDVN
jgi:PAS domain S-box-containing protein